MTLVTLIRPAAPSRWMGALALVFLASCGDSPISPSDLMAGEWRLRQMRLADGTAVPSPDPARFTLAFTSDGRVEVRADCNGCGGRYSLDDESLLVTDLACTLIACPSAPLDQQFLGILTGASEVDVDDDELSIESSRGELQFER